MPSPKLIFSHLKPKRSKYEINSSIAPAELGVILSHLINLVVNSTAFMISDIRGLN